MQRAAMSRFNGSMPPSSPSQQAAAAGLLAMLKSARPHPDTPTPAGPEQAYQDLEGLQLTTSLLEVVLAFAHTIEGLSHLPGAFDILDPNIHAAARNFVAMSAASTAQPPLASTHDINNENFSNSDVNLNMQGPKLTKLHARVSSAGPAANTQAVLSPAGNAAASMPAQQANPSAPGTPVSSFRPNMAFNSLTEDYFNMGPAPFSMGPAPFSAKVPRRKRLCTDLFKAQRARACDNAQNTHGMPLMDRSSSTNDMLDAAEVLASLTSSPMASAGSSTFFTQPHTLRFGALDQLAAADVAAAAAAGAAAAVPCKAPRSPKLSSDDVDWVAPRKSAGVSRKRSSADAFATEESPAPQAAAAVKAAPKRPAAKPRTPRKLERKGPAGSFFQAEAQGVCPETLAAVRAMWQADASLPVFCQNKDSGVRAEGTFQIIDGAKKIVLVSGPGYEPGTVMSPADFERVGDRLATKNWQLSVCVTGLTTRTGCTTELKLGHATRILGVH